MLELGRLGRLECVISGSKGACAVESEKGAGKGEEQRQEEERQRIGEQIGRRGEEGRESMVSKGELGVTCDGCLNESEERCVF